MKRSALLLLCVVANLAAWSEFTIAAVFERDWKAPGDGLLTYDDVSQREWLDIPVSLMTQFPGESLEARFQSAVMELAPSGMFAGFAVAQRSDVFELAESAGIDTAVYDYSINQGSTTALINLLGRTVTFENGRFGAMGFIDEFTTEPFARRLISVFDVDPARQFHRGGAGLFDGSDILDSVGHLTVGVMLYREIPEPSALLLSLTAALGTHLMLRRKRGILIA